MVTGKILEVGAELSLSGRHLNHYFKNRRWQAECVALVGREFSNLPEWLPYVQEGARLLRVPPGEAATVLGHFPHLPTPVKWLEVADSLELENGEWWPRLHLYDTLRTMIVRHFQDLDIGRDSYVIGATPLGRAAAAATAALGFSHISLVDEDEMKLEREARLLRRYLFGVTIETVPARTLTVREKPGSLMLNTVPMQDNSTVLGDLSYFNFMQARGVVIDISECSAHNQLLEEAQRADLKTLSGLVVQAHRDVDLLRRIFPSEYVTYEDYLESFADLLSSLKNPSSV